jgi:hypothetical protein
LPLEILKLSTFENTIVMIGRNGGHGDAICTFTISSNVIVEEYRVWQPEFAQEQMSPEADFRPEELLSECPCFCMITQHDLIVFAGPACYLVRLTASNETHTAHIIWWRSSDIVCSDGTTLLAPRTHHGVIFVAIIDERMLITMKLPSNRTDADKPHSETLYLNDDDCHPYVTHMTPLAHWSLCRRSADSMMVVYGSGVNPDLEDLEDLHTWAQVISSPQTSSDLPDPRVSVLIGRQADLETYNVFADE